MDNLKLVDDRILSAQTILYPNGFELSISGVANAILFYNHQARLLLVEETDEDRKYRVAKCGKANSTFIENLSETNSLVDLVKELQNNGGLRSLLASPNAIQKILNVGVVSTSITSV